MNIVVITSLLQQFLFSKPQSNWQGRDDSSHVKDVETEAQREPMTGYSMTI